MQNRVYSTTHLIFPILQVYLLKANQPLVPWITDVAAHFWYCCKQALTHSEFKVCKQGNLARIKVMVWNESNISDWTRIRICLLFYWSCDLQALWRGLLHHITDKHSWLLPVGPGDPCQCNHGVLPEPSSSDKKYLIKSRPLDPEDPRRLTPTIHPIPPPPTAQLVEAHRSRLSDVETLRRNSSSKVYRIYKVTKVD